MFIKYQKTKAVKKKPNFEKGKGEKEETLCRFHERNWSCVRVDGEAIGLSFS